jgi:hypothetical protein
LLCAGTISFSFKYSNLNLKIKKIIVTILKRRNQSAGNFIFLKENLESLEKNENTSETLCNNSVIKKISVHVPTHLKPINDNEFGHYLAGLIDGDGHFSNQNQLIIVFNEQDASLAYFIKGKIGYILSLKLFKLIKSHFNFYIKNLIISPFNFYIKNLTTNTKIKNKVPLNS